MGAKSSSALKKKDIKDFLAHTHFEIDEIHALYNHFRGIVGPNKDVFDRNEFQQSLGIKGSLFLDRMFQLFDHNHDGFITFPEYLSGLSVLCQRGTLEEKMKFSFLIYDFDGDGKISKTELSKMLKSSLEEHDVQFSASQIQTLVDATYQECDTNKDGFIDADEYRRVVENHPSILSNMTLNFRKVIELRLEELSRRQT